MFEFYRHPFEFDEEATLVNPETESWILNRDHFAVQFKGTRLDFTPTPAEYLAAGIVFDEPIPEPDTIQPEQLLRFLCWNLDHPFFNSEDYLRFLIDFFQVQPVDQVYHQTGLSHHLSLFLQMHHWEHPDLGECPSEMPGFHVLARAIASGDLTEWNSQDPATFNTDWRPHEAVRIAERAQIRERATQGNWISDGLYSPVVGIVEVTDEEMEEQ